jgi:hypothetical protein
MNDYDGVSIAHRLCAVVWGLFLLDQVYEFFTTAHHSPGEWAFIGLFGTLGLCGHIVLAVGASNARPWARPWSIAVAVLYLFAFPFGTMVAVYLFYKCRHQWQIPKQPQSLADAWPASPRQP